jgi:hypothetical protein
VLYTWRQNKQIGTVSASLKSQVLKEIGEGKSPTRGIADLTRPSYWVIRTGDDFWVDYEFQDRGQLEDDEVSEAQFELWRHRGGFGAMLRLAADPESDLIGHVFVRLVDAKTGFCCVGINFLAQSSEKGFDVNRRAILTP